MRKKILVAVTGMSPQIITETVYALHKNHAWLPEKILVLTTLAGRQQIVQQLLGEQGYFQRLRDDYALPEIEFGEHTVSVISENGVDLDDIRTPQQNHAAADLIVRTIYDLCSDDDTELHVSIAGGRKSMGFYIGYALSLFGRVQDKMSHVLVEEDFEQNREFFYPPSKPQFLNVKNGMKDASQAQVMLAEIPFVRMADGKPPFPFDRHSTFSQAVRQTQAMLADVKMTLNPHTRMLSLGDIADIELPAAEFCIYQVMAEWKQQGKELCFFDSEIQTAFTDDYFRHYCRYGKGLQGDSTDAQAQRAAKYAELLKDDGIRSEMQRIFSEANSKIKRQLQERLGDYGSRFTITAYGPNGQKCYALQTDKVRVADES